MWPRGPMDKASAYGAGDCRFESCRGHLQTFCGRGFLVERAGKLHSASLAQLAEHALRKRMVMGSIPIGGLYVHRGLQRRQT